jgi:hypothetical protein
MLSDAQKNRIRVHMGVPVLGVEDSGFALGYRFTDEVGLLEFRMNRLQPYEEVGLTGLQIGQVQFVIQAGPPLVGTIVTMTVTPAAAPSTPIVVPYTVKSSDIDLPTLMRSLSNTWNMAGTTYVAAPGPATVPSVPSGVLPQVQEFTLAATIAGNFAITCAVSGTPNFFPAISLQGMTAAPSFTSLESGVTAVGYIAICDYMESAVAQTSDLLKYSTADVVRFNPHEGPRRAGLYGYWRKRLADILGIPLYPVGQYGGVSTGLTN